MPNRGHNFEVSRNLRGRYSHNRRDREKTGQPLLSAEQTRPMVKDGLEETKIDCKSCFNLVFLFVSVCNTGAQRVVPQLATLGTIFTGWRYRPFGHAIISCSFVTPQQHEWATSVSTYRTNECDVIVVALSSFATFLSLCQPAMLAVSPIQKRSGCNSFQTHAYDQCLVRTSAGFRAPGMW